MKLYHGSYTAVEKPEIIVPGRKLDFGAGFYLTSDFEQAARWAGQTVKRRKEGTPTVTVFEFESAACDALKVKKFEAATMEWLLFVVANRKLSLPESEWDIVIGPVANDQTAPALTLFMEDFLSAEHTIEMLLPQRLKDQYVFKTPRALEYLKFKEVIAVC